MVVVVVVVRGEDREDGGGGMVVGMVMSGEVEEEGEECLLVTHQLHSPPLNQIQSKSSQRPLTVCPPICLYSSNPPVCDCGEPAILLTVRKEGPNKGNTILILSLLPEDVHTCTQWNPSLIRTPTAQKCLY